MSQPTNFRTVGQTMRKKDSMQLLLGKGVYTDDIVRSRSPLVVKLLREGPGFLRNFSDETLFPVISAIYVYCMNRQSFYV